MCHSKYVGLHFFSFPLYVAMSYSIALLVTNQVCDLY